MRIASTAIQSPGLNHTWTIAKPLEEVTAADLDGDSESDLDEPMDSVEVETTDVLQSLALAQASITNLFRLSMLIRNVPVESDYDRASNRYKLPTEWDIRHVRDKFSEVSRQRAWLLERLGQAITKRREYLRYREEHHMKLSTEEGTNPQKLDAVSSLAFTKATTHLPVPGVKVEEALEQIGKDTDSEGSRTSYAPTVFDEDISGILNVPRLPASAVYGEPFQCPYCFTIQIVRSKYGWK